MKREILFTAGALAGAVLLSAPLAGVTFVDKDWIGASGADWSAAGSWNPAGVPFDDDPVTFPARGTTTSVINTGAFDTVAHSILFEGPSERYTFTLEPGTTPLVVRSGGITLESGADAVFQFRIGVNLTQTWTAEGTAQLNATGVRVDDSDDILTFDVGEGAGSVPGNINPGVLEGAGSIIKNGEGDLALSADSTFTGTTTINAGNVNMNHANALGSTTAGTIVNGGQLRINSAITLANEPITINDGGIFRVTNGTYPGDLVVRGGTVQLWNGTLGGLDMEDGSLDAGFSSGQRTGHITGGAKIAVGAQVVIRLSGPNGISSTGFDIAGTVSFKDSTAVLSANMLSDYTLAPTAAGAEITIIDNDGSDPIEGFFAGLPEGEGVTIGAVPFTISYTGGDGNDIVLIQGAHTPLTIAPEALAAMSVGSPVSETLTASGGTAPYTFEVTTGAPPAGLSLSPEGALSGTPTASGDFAFIVTATGSGASETGTRTYSGTVTEAVPALPRWALVLLALTLAAAASRRMIWS